MRRSVLGLVGLTLGLAPSLLAQPPSPSPSDRPVRVEGEIKEPKKLKSVAPIYPEAALKSRVQGTVILEATISADGSVSHLTVLRGIPLLNEAATDAVKQWVYTPTLLNGRPVAVIMTVTVNFKLTGGEPVAGEPAVEASPAQKTEGQPAAATQSNAQKEKGGVPILGVRVRNLGADEQRKPGASSPPRRLIVTLVYSGGPADLAGVRKGDQIVRVDGKEIRNEPELHDAVQKHKVGEAIGIQVLRGGRSVGVDVGLADAVSLYRKGCDAGDSPACTAFGALHETGRGVPRDQVRATQLFGRGCEGGDVNACSDLGRMYERGSGVPKDETRASVLYTQGCDGGDPRGCTFLSYLLEYGRGVPKDEARAFTLSRQACDHGHARGCMFLGWMYQNAKAVSKDEVQAAALYGEACDGGDAHGCANLGWMHQNGKGVAKDEVHAVALYQQACDGGDATGCGSLGWMYNGGYGIAKDEARAVAFYKQACDGGNARGCTNLGWMYQNGKGVAGDTARAVRLYKQGCDAGDELGCTRTKEAGSGEDTKTASASLSPAAVFKKASPSVVVVEALSPEGALAGSGSGVVVGPEAIVTNRHVIYFGSRLRVRHGQEAWPAVVAYSDPANDLVQLKVAGLNAAPVSVRPSTTLEVGERVYAIGSPARLELTLSEGLISSLRPYEKGNLVQTTAAISPGSSGGGLFDTQGRLVGITTFFFKTGENLNFALPAELVTALPARSSTVPAASPGRASSPKPAEHGAFPASALCLPASDLLIGADLRAFFSSDLYKQLSNGEIPGLPGTTPPTAEMKKQVQEGLRSALREGEESTGIRFDRDVDKVIFAVPKVGGNDVAPVGVAVGRFDRERLHAAFDRSARKEAGQLVTREVGTTTLFVSARGTDTLAVLGPTTVAFGKTAQIEGLLERLGKGERPLADKREVLEALASRPGLFFLGASGLFDSVTQGRKTALPMPLPREFKLVMDFDAGMETTIHMGSQVEAAELAGAILSSQTLLRARATQDPELQKIPGLSFLASQMLAVDATGPEVHLVSPTGLGLLAGAVLPSLLRARVSANEAAAIGDIRTLVSAEAAFQVANRGYYGEMSCLPQPATCLEGYTGPLFLTPELAAETKSGYRRTFHPGKRGPNPHSLSSFAYTAVPTDQGTSGVRSFCGDASGRVCFDPDGKEFRTTSGECPASCTTLP